MWLESFLCRCVRQCQAASGAEELTKKFEDGYQGKIPRPYEHGHGELYLCPNCSYLLLNSTSRNNWCPNCKTRINWKKIDEQNKHELEAKED